MEEDSSSGDLAGAGLGGGEVVQVIMQEDGQIVMPEGQFIQLDALDGQAQFIQVTNEDGENQLIQLTSDGQLIQVMGDQEGQEIIQVAPEVVEDAALEPADQEQQQVMDEDGQDVIEEDSAVTKLPDAQIHLEQLEDDSTSENVAAEVAEPMEEVDPESLVQHPMTEEEEPVQTKVESPDHDQPELVAEEAPVPATPTKAAVKKEITLDMSKPIELTSDTVVMVDGKKCVLRVDPQTNHLVAFPFKPSSVRKRGRPRKPKPGDPDYVQPSEYGTVTTISPADAGEGTSGAPEPVEEMTQEEGGEEDAEDNLKEKETNAIGGLLGLSDSDGVRKSTRKRKRNSVFSDYETVVDEDDKDYIPDAGETDPEALADMPAKRGRGRPPKGLTEPSNVIAATQNSMQTLLSSLGYPVKRGRGRPRRYPPKNAVPGPIPAFIIPSPSGGQAVMMTPVQTASQLKAIQQSRVQPIAPAPSPVTTITVPSTSTSDMPYVVVENADGTQIQLEPEKILEPEKKNVGEGQDAGGDDDAGDDGAADGEDEPQEVKELPPAAIIQLPQNLVPLIIPKKEPIKIGLKATESDLEKIKCPKCDYQAYYKQQYQEHIATHTEDIEKCKCCNYVTFSTTDLLDHFKEVHPKCYCPECDFMAEHAYVIKRHMLRHKAQGCECELCGKTYKDQYILKMHIKMVHMPAEVLYGCNVCSKKFSRKAHLKRHLRIHDPEKPFKCPHCDYRGCERSDITKHLLIHEEPRHVCEVCNKAFRHIKNMELHVKRHKGQRDYKCGVCDFYGYTFTDIRKHIERKHSDSKNIICEKCGCAFKNDLLLQEHMKRQCEVLMIEQALAMVGNQGDSGATTIQIPASQLGGDRQIMVDNNQVNITIEQVPEDGLTYTEDQIAGENITVSEADASADHQVELSQISMAEAQVLAAQGVDELVTSDPSHLVEGGVVHLTSDQLELSQGVELPTHISLKEEGVELSHGIQLTQEDLTGKEGLSDQVELSQQVVEMVQAGGVELVQAGGGVELVQSSVDLSQNSVELTQDGVDLGQGVHLTVQGVELHQEGVELHQEGVVLQQEGVELDEEGVELDEELTHSEEIPAEDSLLVMDES